MGANGLSQQPTRRLLRAPLYCPLLSPSESVKMTTVTFSSVSAADAFRSAVSSSGDSLTAALEASAWGLGSVKTSATRSKQTTKAEAARQRRRAASAVAMTYGLVPVKSLHIPREQMKMSTEAADAILAIATPENARRFLADFGSHVPTGIQHLGGIYWKIVEIHAEDEVDESVMLEALAKETGGSHSTKLDIFVMGEGGGSVGRGYFSESREASGVSTSSKSYTVTTRIECVGPNVASFDMFSRVLAVNNKFWFLINRGSPRDLVPVWDLIDDSLHSDLEAMARIKSLLRDAWLDSAQHMPFTPDVRRMVYQERLARNSRSEPNRLLSANKVEARRQVEAAV
ncbi:hypothetical protein Poli38472_010875 [Pythium oligandrum]|uniref:Uncharacterized protein n=1 Tax=Pythium oligandrum TaxID=41045 RepID=A0A8K1CGN7_PYTOL|nr:hypothetical protein Poli38472_010875 [Pythium oligandrum]|eukprot:TMW61812.1 hypothetical protein Poli38472_010875 [Pythium oligandrum]